MVNIPQLIQMEQLQKVKIERLEKRIQELQEELGLYKAQEILDTLDAEILDAEIVEEPND